MWALVILACVLASTEALTKCEELSGEANGLPPIGSFIPQCKENGEFEEKQCWGSTGFCWCVDADGQEVPGTKTRGELECTGKTKCQLMQNGMKPIRVGAFVPKCKENGEFEEMQCWGSTGYCWCVDAAGQEIPGTKVRGDPKCSS